MLDSTNVGSVVFSESSAVLESIIVSSIVESVLLGFAFLFPPQERIIIDVMVMNVSNLFISFCFYVNDSASYKFIGYESIK